MDNTAPLFSTAFTQTICEHLKNEQAVRENFPVWGRLHIDRPLPFLCIYRRPTNTPDHGTEQLLLGQASYILIQEKDADTDEFRTLVSSIMETLVAQYGNALLFELWATEVPNNQQEKRIEKQIVSLAIESTSHHAPLEMLEQLENALLEIPYKSPNRTISLQYKQDIHPPQMKPIIEKWKFSDEELDKNHCYYIGLGVSAVYRQGLELFPYILRDLHHWLTLVLRRSFFTFTQHYTDHISAHYHQLGRRALTNSVWEIDKELSEIKEQFELLFHVTPVNSDQAWLEFKENKYSRTPEFNYRPRPIDPDLLKRQLYSIPIEQIEDPTLAFIFHSQRNEIDRQLTMINDRNNRNFLYGSLQVFGGVEPWLLEIALSILTELTPDNMSACKKSISAIEFAEQAEQLLAHYRTLAPNLQSRIIMRDDIPDILVSKGDLMIGQNSRYLKSRIAGTLAHEIGTHIVTYINGKAQPFHQFHSGMANYEPLQEGLAVFSEYLVGTLTASRLRVLAARVIAVHELIDGAEFIDVFRLLHNDLHFTAYQAYFITMRVFRAGGFTKDMVYLKGFSELLTYLGNGGDLDILYLGKIALDDVPFVDELRWRNVLQDGPLTAHYLTTERSKQLIQSIREGFTITDLILELKS